VADLIDVELFPSMRCPALTLTANLKTEQALDRITSPQRGTDVIVLQCVHFTIYEHR